jgi:hypothetical protein
MTATILPFRTEPDREALIQQARDNYESVFPSETPQDRNRARIDSIRKRDSFKFCDIGAQASDNADDLLMDHADPMDYMPSEYSAPDSDPA